MNGQYVVVIAGHRKTLSTIIYKKCFTTKPLGEEKYQ